MAIAKGDTDAAQKIMGQLESLSNLVGYMNNKAVAHSRCGYTQNAIDLYRKTVKSIRPIVPEVRAIVLYVWPSAWCVRVIWKRPSSNLKQLPR